MTKARYDQECPLMKERPARPKAPKLLQGVGSNGSKGPEAGTQDRAISLDPR